MWWGDWEGKRITELKQAFDVRYYIIYTMFGFSRNVFWFEWSLLFLVPFHSFKILFSKTPQWLFNSNYQIINLLAAFWWKIMNKIILIGVNNSWHISKFPVMILNQPQHHLFDSGFCNLGGVEKVSMLGILILWNII